MHPATALDRELHAVADAARARAYAPYSRLPVGAVAVAEDGQRYVGVNVENASFGLTICAERAAVARAVADGRTRLRALAVAGPASDLAPCGACRQVLAEFAIPGMPVVFPRGGTLVVASIDELLPHRFGLA